MNRSAKVQSIDTIREFRQELKRYLESMRNILESLQVESNRAVNWIEHDRTRYWPRAVKNAEDRLVEARNQLLHCKMAAMSGQRKSCQDEKIAVDRAVARLRLCEAKIRVVRDWRQKLRHHTAEFTGKLARLSHYVEDDIPKALAALDRIIAALEKYTRGQAPQADSPHWSPQQSPTTADPPAPQRQDTAPESKESP